jgi:nitrogen fixation protein NifX
MRVAFASEDGVHINAHFGKAKRMFFYEVTPDGFNFESELQFLDRDEGIESESRLDAKVEALKGCAIVYMAQIGPSAAARLVSRRIHPIKAKETDLIKEAAQRLAGMLGTNPPPWIRKIRFKDGTAT